MKRTFVVVVVALAACQPRQPPPEQDERQTAKGPGRDRFFARGSDGVTHELKLRKLAVNVTTRPGTVHSHLSIEVETLAEGLSEAILRISVPRGAAVTDAVLWMNDRPMRGAFVERQRAREIYTSIVTRRRDPALVTWDGPGWIAVSIFPLEKNHARRFELDWVEPAAELEGRVQYRVPAVGDGDRVIGRASVTVDGRKLPNDAHGLIAIAAADTHKAFTARAPGDPFQQVMVPEPAAGGAPHFVLVAETSVAMTGADRQRQRAIIDGVLGELPAEAKVSVLAADWEVSSIVEDVAAAAWPEALAKLDAIPSAGGLHLERALRDAVACAGKTGADGLLFVGRGEDAFAGDGLAVPMAALRDAHLRLSVVTIGSDEVPRRLGQAAEQTGGEALAAGAFDESRVFLVDALRARPTRPALDARGEGEWHVLRTVTGGAVWIGRTLGAVGAAGAETARADAGSIQAAELAALWQRARLEWHDRDGGDPVANVLTPVTSLLVLETEQDYRRFGLAVPEPIAMEPAAGGTLHQAQQQAKNAGILGLLTPSGETTPRTGNAYGVGGLGLGGGGTGEATIGVGHLGTIGRGGSDSATINGSGYGRGIGGLGGRRARAPEVIPGVATVRGSLDKEIIRRIIRRHINEVRYCYEQELTTKPGLGGRILVQFTIGAAGQVLTSVLQNSTMGNGRVENCILQAVRRWAFPTPLEGGLVVVSYPFVLTPNGLASADAANASASPPAPPPPVRPIDEALATLARGSGVEQIERISSLLGLRRLSNAEVLAWTIDRPQRGLETRLLVARLLELSKHHHDAIRVLSEAAATSPNSIAAELRHLDADADAAEVLRLVARQ